MKERTVLFVDVCTMDYDLHVALDVARMEGFLDANSTLNNMADMAQLVIHDSPEERAHDHPNGIVVELTQADVDEMDSILDSPELTKAIAAYSMYWRVS